MTYKEEITTRDIIKEKKRIYLKDQNSRRFD